MIKTDKLMLSKQEQNNLLSGKIDYVKRAIKIPLDGVRSVQLLGDHFSVVTIFEEEEQHIPQPWPVGTLLWVAEEFGVWNDYFVYKDREIRDRDHNILKPKLFLPSTFWMGAESMTPQHARYWFAVKEIEVLWQFKWVAKYYLRRLMEDDLKILWTMMRNNTA